MPQLWAKTSKRARELGLQWYRWKDKKTGRYHWRDAANGRYSSGPPLEYKPKKKKWTKGGITVKPPAEKKYRKPPPPPARSYEQTIEDRFKEIFTNIEILLGDGIHYTTINADQSVDGEIHIPIRKGEDVQDKLIWLEQMDWQCPDSFIQGNDVVQVPKQHAHKYSRREFMGRGNGTVIRTAWRYNTGTVLPHFWLAMDSMSQDWTKKWKNKPEGLIIRMGWNLQHEKPKGRG
jgi:hypothetical protein